VSRLEILVRDKIDVLFEAQPWIKKLSNQSIAIKYGGELLADDHNIYQISRDISFLYSVGIRPIIIHGFGPQLSKELKGKNIESQKINGTRVYTKEIRDIALDVCGYIRHKLNNALMTQGVKVISPIYKDVLVQEEEGYGLVGNITSISTSSNSSILFDNNSAVLVSPFGTNRDGEICGVNADNAVIFFAEIFSAVKLIINTSTFGVLDENHAVITHLDTIKANELIQQGVIKDGMIPKVLNCLNSGVEKIHIIDGRIPHVLLYEIFTNKGIGTEIESKN